MADISIQHLTKKYPNGTLALQDVSLDIPTGEFVVLVGPSGCGKSTLLRSIAGLEETSGGAIEIGGRRVDLLPPAERGVALVFQDYALYPHMTVRENLAFGLKIRKLESAEIQRRIEATAKTLEIEAILGRKPAQLSGGQRQRVAIGRALVKEASVLLMDEPLSNLDAQLRAQMRVELQLLHQRIGSTTIYVTHDQEEAMALADRIVVLDRGKIQQVAAPLEIYHHPANRFVASFIGSPRMNFLDGELQMEGDRWIFRFGDLRLDLTNARHPERPGPVTLGFRPEAVELSAEGLFRAHIQSVQSYGHEIQVWALIGGAPVVLRIPHGNLPARSTGSLRPGSSASLNLRSRQLHWFERSLHGARIDAREPELSSSTRPPEHPGRRSTDFAGQSREGT